MGIRFACSACSEALNIKNELAGRRSKCPKCGQRFRIPLQDQQFADPLEEDSPAVVNTGTVNTNAASPTTASSAAAKAPVNTAVATPAAAVTLAAKEKPTKPTAPVTLPKPDPLPVIDPLAEAPTACWYVRPQAGGQYGPATAEVMRQWLTENRVAASSLVWREGWATWRSAQEVFPQLASQVAGAGPGAGAGPVAGAAAPAARTPVQPSYLSSAQTFSDPSADADLSMPRPDDAAQNLYQRRREMARRRMTVVAILLVVSILLIVGLCVVVFWR